MSRFVFASLFVTAGLFAACGGSGGSGLTGTKLLVELTADERGSLCDYTANVEGGYGASMVCGNGITITVKAKADCIANLTATAATCTATVDNAEACADAVAGDLCKLLSEPACAFALQCAGG